MFSRSLNNCVIGYRTRRRDFQDRRSALNSLSEDLEELFEEEAQTGTSSLFTIVSFTWKEHESPPRKFREYDPVLIEEEDWKANDDFKNDAMILEDLLRVPSLEVMPAQKNADSLDLEMAPRAVHETENRKLFHNSETSYSTGNSALEILKSANIIHDKGCIHTVADSDCRILYLRDEERLGADSEEEAAASFPVELSLCPGIPIISCTAQPEDLSSLDSQHEALPHESRAHTGAPGTQLFAAGTLSDFQDEWRKSTEQTIQTEQALESNTAQHDQEKFDGLHMEATENAEIDAQCVEEQNYSTAGGKGQEEGEGEDVIGNKVAKQEQNASLVHFERADGLGANSEQGHDEIGENEVGVEKKQEIETELELDPSMTHLGQVEKEVSQERVVEKVQHEEEGLVGKEEGNCEKESEGFSSLIDVADTCSSERMEEGERETETKQEAENEMHMLSGISTRSSLE